MRRTATTLIAAAVLGTTAIGTSLTPTLASAAAAKVTVKGSLGADGAGYRVILLTKGGSGLVATADGSGAFSFTKVKNTAVQSSTLQLIAPSGSYAGPIILKVDVVGTGVFAAHEQLSGVSANLKLKLLHQDGDPSGRVVGAMTSKLIGAPGTPGSSTTWYLNGAVQADSQGLPLGAAKSGLVAKPKSFSPTQKRKITGAPAPLVAMGMPVEVQVLGLDADSDGVPNVFDVDDNGNKSLDSVDAASASTTASTNPWTDIRREYQNGGATYNAEVPGSAVTASDVAEAIGGNGQFAAWMFLDEKRLSGTSGLPSSTVVDWARVDCGSLRYCGANQTHESNYGVMGEASNDSWWQTFAGNNPVKWNAYPGHAFNCGQGDAATDAVVPASVLGTSGPDNPANGLSLFCWDQGPGQPKGHIWGGMLAPKTGADTLTDFKPGDVYNVQYQVHGESSPRSFTMVLAPYYATVPGLLKVNGATPDASGTFALDNDGMLTLTFTRPQRLTVAGESGTFMDQAGLHYGLILGPGNGSREFGCSWYNDPAASPVKVNRYSNTSNLSTAAKPANPWESTQWPLSDNGSVDEAPNTDAATQKTFTFTVDVRGCIADAVAQGWIAAGDISNAKPPYATLTAAGEQLTGGSNRSTLLFHLSNIDVPVP